MLLALTLVLLIAAPMLTAHAESAAPGIYFIYADIQAEQTQLNSDYSDYCYYATSWRHQLPTTDAKRGVSSDGIFYLAQNEREGIQLYLTQPGDTASELSVTVSAFTNADNATMPADVYLEQYVTPNGTKWGSRTLYIADPLVPYRSESFTVQPGNNQALYIETRSASDQAPGAYYATVTISDENSVIATKTIAAVVWDFALPQQHYGSMVVGLYNAASGYESTMNFLKQNGVRTYTYQQEGKTHEEILPEDTAKAEAILEGWDEYLLDHGINASELPRYLIDTDEKAAELAMADIRRKYFSIPLLNLSPTSSGTYDADTLSVIRHYQDVIGDNDELTSKAYFYCRDEIDPSDQNTVNALVNAAENAWPEVKRMFTYNGKGGAGSDYTQAMAALDPYHNVICINTQLINPYYTSSYSESLANDYLNSYPQRWRYPCEIRTGGFELWIWRLSTVGIYRRLPFWQQHNNNEDCMLYWNAAYLANNADVWSAHELPGSNGVSTGNGNGILLYPGAPIGEDPNTPIGSLRLKQIASGLDDEDYLYLADEFLPEADRPIWKEKSDYWWTKCDDMTNNRIALGNKLENATVEHHFGEWHTVVEPDHAHNGLENRTCLDCGTEESRETAKLPSVFVGHSLSLNGDIGVNFYLNLSDEQAEATTVSFSWYNKELTDVPVIYDEDQGCYKAECPISAAEMTYDITASVSVNEKATGDTNTYSAAAYGKTILSDDYRTEYLESHTREQYEKLSTLIKAMLSYGAKAQIEFDRNTENLADHDIDDTPPAITADDIPDNHRDMVFGLENCGLQYIGPTVMFLSESSLRLYYRITDEDAFDAVKNSITFDGNTVGYSEKGNYIYFEKRNIPASQLSRGFDLTIGRHTYTYAVTDYVRACLLSDRVSDPMKDLAAATYRYNQAAAAYFDA